MGIDSLGPELEILNNQEDEKLVNEEEPINVEEALAQFSDPVEIKKMEDIEIAFKERARERRICISIPVTSIGEADRQTELHLISKLLRKSIFNYTGLSQNTDIGSDIEGIIGEATSDLGKHTFFNEKFSTILVSVSKNGQELAFHLINPARPTVDLGKIEQEDSIEEYSDLVHGQNLAKGLREDLLSKGCKTVEDTSRVVRDAGEEKIGVVRDIQIELPEYS